MTRIVFMGTPEFAVPTLARLADHFEVAGVFTQPDKPAGRGQQLTAPPVKRLAQERSLPVFQPRTLRDQAAQAQLAAVDLMAPGDEPQRRELQLLRLAAHHQVEHDRRRGRGCPPHQCSVQEVHSRNLKG